MLKKTIICLSLVVWLSPVIWAADQDVLKCVDNLVYGVIRLDTKTLDFYGSLNALTDLAGKTFKPGDVEHLNNLVKREFMGADLATFHQAGGREIYAIFNVRDMPLCCLAFPVDEGVNPARLRTAIKEVAERSFNIDDLAIESHGRLVLAGKAPMLKAVIAGSGPVNSIWTTLLDQKPVRPLRIVIVPNDMQLRVLTEMWPDMPGVPGLAQLKTMVQQLKWLTLSAQIVPDMAFEVSLEMQSKDMADQAVAFWKVMTPFLAEPLRMEPTLLNLILVNSQGPQVTWSLNHAQSQKLLGRLFLNPLSRSVSVVQRTACATNIKDIGLATLMYANDHNDLLPPNLTVLTELAQLPEKALICPSSGAKNSYGYCGDGLDVSCEPTLMTVYDKKGNHPDSGRNVLFLDSHVEWVTETHFQELAVKVNAERKKRGLPEHVFE